ncbi:copper chaperone PCu(A)C [Sphingomonas japonica]|uniref:Copper(I)-binding protein n=1 Tax=Sphingomonas japonica TaxID=511662 RepID=A0ABX0U4X6_9SPHN|nr:copper chaperone PCu(A)C [Sphingomonas japonica]NIJ24367.1 hypothetical protein [Sphingomonas japonica]
MRFSVAALSAAAALAACQPAPETAARDAWLRLPAVPGRPAAAYFTLESVNAKTLVGVSTPVAERSELHESSNDGGMMAMRPLASVPVEPDMPVRFAPGGKHVMLFDLTPQAMQDARTTLTLRFEDGSALDVDAALVKAGEEPPFE